MKCFFLQTILLLVVSFVGVWSPLFADEVLFQKQLDEDADSIGCAFIHAQDWRSWVKMWRDRGCTDEMFVSAFSRVAEQTMGAEYWTANEYKCLQALSSIMEFNVPSSNLTTVVRIVKKGKSHRVRRSAASTYYDKTKGSDTFIDFAEDILLSTNLHPEVEAVVMSGLWHDARERQRVRGNWESRVSKLMHNYVEMNVRGLDGADQILMWIDPDYANSSLRKSIRKRILAPEFKDVIDRYKGGIGAGERIQMKYRREEEAEKGK